MEIEDPPETRPPTQLWLIPYENPLRRILTKERMAEVPKRPGVYFFYGEGGKLLYVGKSKDLRTRILSYRRARPGEVGRKTIRLIHEIRSLEWEECVDECAALLLENRKLRELVPPFNEANTKPESYHYVGLRMIALPEGTEVRIRLTGKRVRRGEKLYGAFKGRGRLQRTYGALLRLIWLASEPAFHSEPSFPHRLLGGRLPPEYRLRVGAEWAKSLRLFFEGKDTSLVDRMRESTERMQAQADPAYSPFFVSWVKQDLETLESFFQRGPKRLRGWTEARGLTRSWIEQDEVDDFQVEERFGMKKE
jgi:excinuclease UvrABC nuclease subunit